MGGEAVARVGRTLGKYRLERLIGSGGMADVYEARHDNGHRVALKLLKPALSVSADVQKRFRREGYAANRVAHPGAVRVLDDDVTDDGLTFLILELLEGKTLAELARENDGKLGPALVTDIGRQVLDVLAAAHVASVIHRDVKPENLLLLDDGTVKVLDFGIASVRNAAEATATVTGRMLGTPAFMPPEQAYGRRAEIDERSDLWALGATLFTLLAGRVVHAAPTAEETLIKAATEAAPSLRTVAPEVPVAIVRVVDRALAREKSDRWPTAAAMRDALTEAAAGGTRAAPVPLHRRVIGGSLAALGIATLLTLAHRMTPPPVASEAVRATTPPPIVMADVPVAPPLEVPLPVGSAPRAEASPAAPPRSKAMALPVAPSVALVSSAPPRMVCGFDIDADGRKWPRRCPAETSSR